MEPSFGHNMDFEDFQPKINRAPTNSSVRTGASKLSLKHHNDKLSLNSRGGRTALNESQRLDDEPPVRHNERTFLNNARNNHSQRPASPDSGWLVKPKQRFQVRKNVFPLNLPGPQQQEAKQPAVESENTSVSSFKENVARDPGQTQPKKTLKSATVSRNTSSSRDNPEVPSGSGDSRVPLQSHTEQSPRKTITPSPHKSNSKRGNSSTLASLPFESKGFCPICQVPFSCLNVQPSVHSSSCLEPSDGPECAAGKNCKNTSYHHYRDFRHEVLAEERTFAGVDASELEPEIEERLLNDSEEDVSSKRKHAEDDLPSPKRIKSAQEADEQSSQSSNDSNPFLQPTELGLEETDATQHIYSPELFPDLDGDHGDEVPKEESVKQAAEIQCREGPSIPCVAGVCEKKQLGVEITVQTPSGKDMTVSIFIRQ
ncbi:hypothetical protein B566_EDAN006842 [Ephemera danica]|nr:hypothetical protein B566_EDAN006842 [Ephemera danica]